MVYVILELSLSRNKGQPVDTVMKSVSLHLKTPDDHLEAPTDMCESYYHMLISSQKNYQYAKYFSEI